MISDFIKSQLENVSKMIDGVFGMIDDAGTVLFCSEDKPCIGENFFTDTTDNNASVFSNSSFIIGDYMCHQATLRSENSAFLFLRLPENKRDETSIKIAESLLELASYALAGHEIDNDKQIINAAERLIKDEDAVMSQTEAGDIFGKIISKAEILRLVIVTPFDLGEREAAESVIRGIFPQNQGFCCVPYNGKILIICPLVGDVSEDVLKDYVSCIRDTVLSEAMTDVCVSVSGLFYGISGLGKAYKEAEKAYEIGKIFDIDAPYCAFDRLGLEKFIYSFSDDACREYVTETFGKDFLEDKSSRELLYTVKVFLDCNQNGSEAARKLYIHRNTLVYRLEKFNKITGLDCANFNTAFKIHLAMTVLGVIEKRGIRL